ncbi:MAG TPA: hypothetical protein DDY98_06885 [Ruminococcaceae bacterium]|nr:hypothetical protein [Oscillospiraceae bacterium]
MIKKLASLFLIFLLLLGLSGFAFAEEAGTADAVPNEVYGGYEDDFFNNGYEGIEESPGVAQEPVVRWYQRLSVVPIVFGVIVGAVAVFILRKNSGGTMTVGGTREVHSQSRTVAQSDREVNVHRTTRRLNDSSHRHG